MKKGKLFEKIKKNLPTILSLGAVIGVISSNVLTAKATPKAVCLIEDEKSKRRLKDDNRDPTILETIKLTWKCYIPSALVTAATCACILGSNSLNKKRQASLLSAYALINESYKNYKKSANDVYGPDADRKINAEIAKKNIIFSDGFGASVYNPEMDYESETILFCDLYSKRYFHSTLSKVIDAEYHINRNLLINGSSTINEFYDFLGMSGIENGYELGWLYDYLMTIGFCWLDFDNQYVELDDGLKCCIISSFVEPTLLEVQENDIY